MSHVTLMPYLCETYNKSLGGCWLTVGSLLWSTVPSSGKLLCQRAELHMEMKNFSLAVQDTSSLCRIKPFWTKVRDIPDPRCDDECYPRSYLTFILCILGSLFTSHSAEESRPE